MKVLDTVALFQLFEISGWSLWIHRLWAALLGENKLTDTLVCLLYTEALQEINYI